MIAGLPIYFISEDFYIIKILRMTHYDRLKNTFSLIWPSKSLKIIEMKNWLSFFYTTLSWLHLLSCIWIFIGKVQVDTNDTWIERFTKSDGSLYIEASFFVVTSASTVGYGDIEPQNELEIIVCMLLMFLGTMVVAMSQSKMFQSLQYSSSIYAKTKREKSEVENWLYEKERARSYFANNNEMPSEDVSNELAFCMNEIQAYFTSFHNVNNFRAAAHEDEFFEELEPRDKISVFRIIFGLTIR